MFPVARLVHERNCGAAAAAEEDCRDRDSLGVLPLGCDGRALAGSDREASIRVRSRGVRGRGPRVAAPVGCLGRRLLGHPLPPRVEVRGQRGVREDRIAPQGLHRVRIGFLAGPGCHAEETRFRVDGIQAAVGPELHPADVVADCLDRPAGHGRHEHREVRFPAGRRECRRHVLDVVVGGRELEDEHVFSEPPVVACHHRGDAEGEALLAE